MIHWDFCKTTLSLCILAFFVTMVGRLAISPIAPLIVDEFGVSKSLVGLSLTGLWVAYALMQFPSGVLGGRYGEKLVILASVGGVTSLSVFLALSPVFAVFVLCCDFLGGSPDCTTPSRRRSSRGRSRGPAP